MDNVSTAVGPGSILDQGIAPKPLLEGASEYEYVEILNPLPVDFVGLFAVTRPVRAPVRVSQHPSLPSSTKNADDVTRNYGLDLNNQDHPGKANIQSRITIPAGQTMRILGNEAQVIIRQLVNEIMQREGKSLMLADPYQRSLVEAQVVRNRQSVSDLLGTSPVTVHEQIQTAIDKSNLADSEEFPDFKEEHEKAQPVGTGAPAASDPSPSSGEQAHPPQRRSPGRPKRVESPQN